MKLDSIYPYNDEEVYPALVKYFHHPMMEALLSYTFPDKNKQELMEVIEKCTSIYAFQKHIVYTAHTRLLKETTEGFTTSGFDHLDNKTSYLYISNHRDIVLDTSLHNVTLLEKNMIMTASAIGDNLVQDEFIHALSRMSRNFLVRRSLGPRELLKSSIDLSNYIYQLISEENRSVWLAQKEGRTKDGNDQTHPGILKMLTLGKRKGQSLREYLNELKIVPIAISYEYDPTDYLKMPSLLATYYDEEYVKTKDEDFNAIMAGFLGKKKRIHMAAGEVIDWDHEFQGREFENNNVEIQAFAQNLSKKIHQLYTIWPANFIAYDLLHETDKYSKEYTIEEKENFQNRMKKKTGLSDPIVVKNFLLMYANPVVNKYEN